MNREKSFIKGCRYKVSKRCYDRYSPVNGLEAGKIYTCIEDGKLHLVPNGPYFSEWVDKYFTLITKHTKGGKLL